MRTNYRIFALALMMSACTAPGKQPPQLVPDPSIIPAFPPAPVDLSRPVGQPIQAWLDCLQRAGWQSCRGTISSPAAPKPMAGAPK